MLAVFRTDASKTIGTGHVMRSLALAEALISKGFETLFVCRELEGHLCDEITRRGFEVRRLPAPDHSIPKDPSVYSSWLGVAESRDAEETSASIAHVHPELLVVDHYGLGGDWETSMRPGAGRLLAIDDLGRAHDCDLLVDQNLISGMRNRYDGLVAERCNLMLGPEYALLQPIYAQLHDRIPPREGPVRRVLVSFGGSDPPNLTERTLECILELNRPDITADVVVSSGYSRLQKIQERFGGNPRFRLHKNLANLSSIMAGADLAVGAGGVTSWERLCLGLPAIVVTIADNQRPVAAGLHEMGLVHWIGHHDEVDVRTMRQALNGILERGLDGVWSQNCWKTVDGRGALRVATAMTADPRTPLRFRYARVADEALLLEWANDPVTRRNAFSPGAIASETHRGWFFKRLRDVEGCRLYIAETLEGLPVGQVRFESQGQDWEVHYSIAPEFRGYGLGGTMLKNALIKFKGEGVRGGIFGRVKQSNIASKRIFERLHFSLEGNGMEDVLEYHLNLEEITAHA